jgi:5-methylcytosine-specific restriction enzyme A
VASRVKNKWDHGGKSRQARGYGRDHERIRAELLRTVILCEECTRQGRVTVGRIADHIVPLAKGGPTIRSNYQLLCKRCSNIKTIQDGGRKCRVKRPIGLDGWPIEEPAHV